MDGFYMCVWALIADLDHVRSKYGGQTASSNNPCDLCPCNASTMPWYDFRPTAKWLKHIYSVAQWRENNKDKKLSAIWEIVGVTILSYYPDWMHCKSLGTDKPLLGAQHMFSSSGQL